jgi:hypothetical protein
LCRVVCASRSRDECPRPDPLFSAPLSVVVDGVGLGILSKWATYGGPRSGARTGPTRRPRVQEDLQEFGRLSLAGVTWWEARDKLAEWWPVPEVVAALAEAPEGEPFELEVELGGVPREVARWLNPLVLRVLRASEVRLKPPTGET